MAAGFNRQPSMEIKTAAPVAILHRAADLRDDADAASLDAIKAVVNAVKADSAETARGEFYEALGYVRESERKSGLHRSQKGTAAAAKG